MFGEDTFDSKRQRVTGQRYVDLMLGPVVSLWKGAFGDTFPFMQDNTPPHTRRVAKNCLEMEGVTELSGLLVLILIPLSTG